MNKTFSIIGGDLRIVKLAQMLKKDGNTIKTFGLEESKEIIENEKYNLLEDCIKNSQIVISSIPLSKDGKSVYMPYSNKQLSVNNLIENIKGKVFFAGSIDTTILNECEKQKKAKVFDLMKNEELTIANAISTAEGAIQIAMEQTQITINNSKILVLGFGRIGKLLAKKLSSLGADVSCEARKQQDIAWIKAYGYKAIHLDDLKNNLNEFDIIFNTVPYLLLDKEKLSQVKSNCLIIDLASKPGGVDFEQCNIQGIKNIWALALPGKVAPITSAKYIKETIYKIIDKE